MLTYAGYWVLGVGCWMPSAGAGCWVPDAACCYWVLGAGCRVPSTGCQVPGARCQKSPRCQVPGAKNEPGARCQKRARCQVPRAECRCGVLVLGAGCWVLDHRTRLSSSSSNSSNKSTSSISKSIRRRSSRCTIMLRDILNGASISSNQSQDANTSTTCNNSSFDEHTYTYAINVSGASSASSFD